MRSSLCSAILFSVLLFVCLCSIPSTVSAQGAGSGANYCMWNGKNYAEKFNPIGEFSFDTHNECGGNYTYYVNPCAVNVLPECSSLNSTVCQFWFETLMADNDTVSIPHYRAIGEWSPDITFSYIHDIDTNGVCVTSNNAFYSTGTTKVDLYIWCPTAVNAPPTYIPGDPTTIRYSFGDNGNYKCDYHRIEIAHQSGCPFQTNNGNNPPSNNGGGGLSGGSIFLIIFFVGFGVYFIGGSAWNYHQGGRDTKSVLPNYGFWAGLFGLCGDGIRFTQRKLCGGPAAQAQSRGTSVNNTSIYGTLE